MNKLIVILIILLSQVVFSLEGPDFMLLGQSYIPMQNRYCISAATLNDTGLKATFQNAYLYNIGALDWYFTGVSYATGCWTFNGFYKSYGVDDLYETNHYSFNLHYLFFEQISIGAGYSRYSKDFGVGYYQGSSNHLSVSAGYTAETINAQFKVDNIALNDDRDIFGDPELLLGASWLAYRQFTILGLYYRNQYGHDRFLIGQDLELGENFLINAGIMSAPEVYFIGIEIVYKRLVFGYTYYDQAGLPNSSKLTLSYR